ncbi:MAG: hypothetical protein ACHQWU_06110 [Gemmatimonadales bacterium]
MADWQVGFNVVPRRALARHGAAKASSSSSASWWQDNALPSDLQHRLGGIAPAELPGTAEHRSWGIEDGNRIDIWYDAGQVSAVTAQVDVRRLDSKFSATLLQFVRTADAVLVRSDGLVVEPEIGAYAASLRSAGAWKFASDPGTFLASYAADDDTDDGSER